MTPGAGTALNVLAVLAGGSAGVLVGARLPLRVRDVVTDGLGLVTLVVAGLNAYALTDPDLTTAVGAGVGVLIVLGSVVVGGIVGAALRLEDRLEGLGGWIQRHWPGGQGEHRFVEGFVTASLIFCVGPLTILGTLQDGLGEGIELLALKSVLDGFAALAFAASLGWGSSHKPSRSLSFRAASRRLPSGWVRSCPRRWSRRSPRPVGCC